MPNAIKYPFENNAVFSLLSVLLIITLSLKNGKTEENYFYTDDVKSVISFIGSCFCYKMRVRTERMIKYL